MTSNQRNTAVLIGASGLMAVIAAAYFATAGLSEESLDLMLRLSARIAYLVLLVVFVARPLNQMLKTPQTRTLLRNRRLVGIAFAGVHIAHFGLLVTKQTIVPDFELLIPQNIPGMLVYFVILSMLITSWNAPARTIGPKAWKVLHKIGIYILFVAFAQAVLPYPGEPWETINWGFIALIATALVIRLTAFLAKRSTAQPQ